MRIAHVHRWDDQDFQEAATHYNIRIDVFNPRDSFLPLTIIEPFDADPNRPIMLLYHPEAHYQLCLPSSVQPVAPPPPSAAAAERATQPPKFRDDGDEPDFFYRIAEFEHAIEFVNEILKIGQDDSSHQRMIKFADELLRILREVPADSIESLQKLIAFYRLSYQLLPIVSMVTEERDQFEDVLKTRDVQLISRKLNCLIYSSKLEENWRFLFGPELFGFSKKMLQILLKFNKDISAFGVENGQLLLVTNPERNSDIFKQFKAKFKYLRESDIRFSHAPVVGLPLASTVSLAAAAEGAAAVATAIRSIDFFDLNVDLHQIRLLKETESLEHRLHALEVK
jgi:hypothetical protein